MNRFNEDGEIRSRREVINGIATGALTKEEKSSGKRNLDRVWINHAHRYQGMTPGNESIRRSITTGAAFRETRGALSPSPINIPYRRDNNLLPCPMFWCFTRDHKDASKEYALDIAEIEISPAGREDQKLISLRCNRSGFSLPRPA